ncbi:MAG: hypothetical protein ACOVQY_03710, partial [Erythrobacter sp.]
ERWRRNNGKRFKKRAAEQASPLSDERGAIHPPTHPQAPAEVKHLAVHPFVFAAVRYTQATVDPSARRIAGADSG